MRFVFCFFFQPQLLWFDCALYDPIAAWAVHRSKVSPNIPLLIPLSKNFWTETYTVIYQHLFYWPPLQKYLLNNSLSLSLSLFWFFAISLLSQVHSQSWIVLVHGDNAWYQWSAASNFLPHAAPLFHAWTVQVQWIDTPYIASPPP